MIEDIKKIITAGVRAPSGDNSQPWRFVVENNIIKSYNLPEKDNPIFNYKQRGSHVAHGALIENMVIAAAEFGYSTKVELFPDKKDENFISQIILEKNNPPKDSLYPFIFERAINRKKYEDTILTSEQKDDLLKTVFDLGGGKILLTEKPEDKKILGDAVSKNEVVMLENKTLHNYFFSDVRWTEEEEKKHKNGLYLKTMELVPPQVVVFKILSHWNRAKFLIKLGIAKFIAKENAKVYSSGSVLGIVTINSSGTKEDFILAGRIMERLWLKATKMGLGFQPVTGIVYLVQRVLDGTNEALSDQHVDLVKESFLKIQNVFGVNNDKDLVAIFFRVGKGGKPSGYSSRLEPVIKIQS